MPPNLLNWFAGPFQGLVEKLYSRFALTPDLEELSTASNLVMKKAPLWGH
jgi:hypothetical protein